MASILGIEVVNKLEGMDLSMLAKYVEERYIKGTETIQPNQPSQRELIDSPSIPGSCKRSRRNLISITSKNVEHGVETSNVPTTFRSHISSTTSTCYASCIGTYETKVEYDVVYGNIRMTYSEKVFMHRLKESCIQHFKEHLHLPFSKILVHLKKKVINVMETEFGIGWSVKQIKKQMTQNCKRFCCNQMKKIKGIPPELRNKRRPIDVSVKVWKYLVKSYDRVDAHKKSSEESIQVFEFSTIDYFKFIK
jgi:hypothetical protein